MKQQNKSNNKVRPFRNPEVQKRIDTIQESAIMAFRKMNASRGFQRLGSGKITEDEYKAVMREVYRYTREVPQMFGCMASRLKGKQREAVKVLMKHGMAEMDHDQMAIEDAVSLGDDRKEIEVGRPLPATTALVAYAYHQIERMDATGFLGFVYFLEYIPCIAGSQFTEKIQEAGIPEKSMSFLKEHTEVDPAHTKLLDRYVEMIVSDDEHLENTIYSIECTADCYAHMISSAIQSVGQRRLSSCDPLEQNERK